MNTYTPTIGLEIHAELKTKSKMFCGCVNDPDELTPNRLICPVCMAHPGTLPVINKNAVQQVLRVGSAVGGTHANFTEFDRKNYFYPDIPKNYQISQYKYPLVSGGMIAGVNITRVHLEEDTARSVHTPNGSKVDYNRAGVPLMELVTEPVIHSAKKAVEFAKELRLLLIYLGSSDANLEKGEMRIEANISVSRDMTVFGTKVEVKNLNSFKAVEQAIQHEVERQIALLEKGEKIIQETRGWDEDKQKTFSQRLKEDSHDYRYYPDPDLPKIYVSEVSGFDSDTIRKSLPQLPWELRATYESEGMKTQTVEILVGDPELNHFYQTVLEYLGTKEEHILTANYLTSDVIGLLSKSGYDGMSFQEMQPKEFAELIMMLNKNVVSSRGAKDVLARWVQVGGSPEKLANELHLVQISDDEELKKVINTILEKNVSVVKEYKDGKEASLQFLIGQGMRLTKGAANPEKLQKLFKEQISKN
jgi:aspartyl-tRNA(Asn)/glutamyl-tRNA(Gln) amidotransferase subunit B